MDTIKIIEGAMCPKGQAYIVDTKHFGKLLSSAMPYTVRPISELPEGVRKVIEDMRRAGGEPFAVIHNRCAVLC